MLSRCRQKRYGFIVVMNSGFKSLWIWFNERLMAPWYDIILQYWHDEIILLYWYDEIIIKAMYGTMLLDLIMMMPQDGLLTWLWWCHEVAYGFIVMVM